LKRIIHLQPMLAPKVILARAYRGTLSNVSPFLKDAR